MNTPLCTRDVRVTGCLLPIGASGQSSYRVPLLITVCMMNRKRVAGPSDEEVAAKKEEGRKNSPFQPGGDRARLCTDLT